MLVRLAEHPASRMPLRSTQPPLALASVAAAVCVLMAGCASSPSDDSSYGMTTRALTAQQIRNPQAPVRNAAITPATDGRTMREAMDRHVGSFKEPPPTTVINIGVGR